MGNEIQLAAIMNKGENDLVIDVMVSPCCQK